jgi:hypothetical protein
MNGKWFSIAVLVATAVLLLSFSGCGHNQHLTSIQVQPSSGGTFFAADPSLFLDFKAFGSYIHPPQTKDITTQVTWQTDNPQVVQVTSAGVVSPNLGCGLGNVFATFKDGSNLVISNSVPITVEGPASQGCPQGGGTHNLSLSVTNGSFGVITSSPAGITCGTTCAVPFAAGSSVALTAVANTGHTFGGWGVGCTTISGATCNVTMNADVAITATFN